MKVHIGILTSRHPEKAVRCLRSAKLQDNMQLEVSYSVIVNSVVGYYYEDVMKAVGVEDITIPVINTSSNGRPGMGKNAGFDYMRENIEADYYMLLDGDDFLYPPALSILQEFMEAGYDLIAGQSQDQWINGKIHLSWEHTQPNNTVTHNRDLLFPQIEGSCGTHSVDRIYAVSKDFLHKMPRFNEDLDLHEDFFFTVECTKMRMNGDLNYMSMNTSFVYGYDMDGQHQVDIFQSDKRLAQWNVDKFLALSQKYIPVKFSENPFAEVSNPDQFFHEDKQEFYHLINSHEANIRTK
jgi:glycosyltransferase involved in cell wall biosynthesis